MSYELEMFMSGLLWGFAAGVAFLSDMPW